MDYNKYTKAVINELGKDKDEKAKIAWLGNADDTIYALAIFIYNSWVRNISVCECTQIIRDVTNDVLQEKNES